MMLQTTFIIRIAVKGIISDQPIFIAIIAATLVNLSIAIIIYSITAYLVSPWIDILHVIVAIHGGATADFGIKAVSVRINAATMASFVNLAVTVIVDVIIADFASARINRFNGVIAICVISYVSLRLFIDL